MYGNGRNAIGGTGVTGGALAMTGASPWLVLFIGLFAAALGLLLVLRTWALARHGEPNSHLQGM